LEKDFLKMIQQQEMSSASLERTGIVNGNKVKDGL
jgi:hypothetical protein